MVTARKLYEEWKADTSLTQPDLAKKYNIPLNKVSIMINDYRRQLESEQQQEREREEFIAQKRAEGKIIRFNAHCQKCIWGEKVSREGQEIPIVMCPFRRCVSHRGFIKDKESAK